MLKKIGIIAFLVFGLVVMFVMGASMMISNQTARVEAFNDVALKDIQEGKIAMREDRPFSAEEMKYAFNNGYSLFVIKLQTGHTEYAIHKTDEKDKNEKIANAKHTKNIKMENVIGSLTEQDAKNILATCDGKDYCMIMQVDDKTLEVRS